MLSLEMSEISMAKNIAVRNGLHFDRERAIPVCTLQTYSPVPFSRI